MSQYLVREITRVVTDSYGVSATLRAVAATNAPGMPGYLTGEPYAVQGIETSLPNLPELELPRADDEGEFVLRVRVVGASTVRVTLAERDDPVAHDDGTALGIVTNPHPEDVVPQVTTGDEVVEVRTARLLLRVGSRPFSLHIDDLANGRTVLRTADRLRQAAGLPMAPAVLATDDGLTLNLELGADEQILGFGEQFSPLVKNGQRLTLKSSDALGTGTGQAYKPVPVWHSTHGYTGFLNTGAIVDADVGHTRPSVLDLSTRDAAFDAYIFVGNDPRERLSAFTNLTGRADIPPVWAFGYWMGRCRYHNREEMLEVARTMRTESVPCDVLHLDPDWLIVDRLNCDFIWNTERFGDRRAFVNALAEHGVRLSVWELPYLDPASPRYAEAEHNGYLVRTQDGETARIAGTPTPDGRHRALIDFSDPDAVAWWQELHADFLDDGVAVFKTDFGEGLPDDVAFADGTPANHAHNLYPLRYNAAVYEGIGRLTGRTPLVWGRSGWAGSHRYPGQWGGDAESTVAGMQATLRGGLSYAISAPGLWSHDIGGFFGPELTPELYIRWTQFGAFSPLMRAHGLRPREPWAFGERAFTIAREWIRRRYEMLPYLWQAAHESLRHGWPMLRPLALEFPDDPVCSGLDSQYMLGSDLLVVPVFADSAEPVSRQFYVPAGGWTDLFTAERFVGPGFATRDIGLERMPVLVCDGALVPRTDVDATTRNTDDQLQRPWTLHAYGDETPDPTTLVGFDGTPTRVAIDGTTVTSEGTQTIAPTVVRHHPG